ncbi:MAG: TonB family protein [Sulfuricurvum sp.]|nr:TonB family protein [Sulfuricurvum sp.]
MTMTPQTKAFGLSFALHTLMALLALFALTQMYPPVNLDIIPMKHVTLLTLSQVTPAVTEPMLSSTPPTAVPIAAKIPPQPISKLLIPTKVQPVVTQTIAPSLPPVIQQTIPAETKPTMTAETKAPPVQASVPTKPKIDITSEKKSFYASLRAKIQQSLRYPFAARRAGKEGEINMRFTLTDDGTIKGISVQHGEDIFHNAAKLAVASASGVKVPEVLSDTLPAEIDLTLEFKLN